MAETEWEVFYHYTSLENFERIIKDGYLKMTDIIKSNDPAEGVFAFEALKDAYQKLYDDGEISWDEFKRLRESFFEASGNEFRFVREQQVILSISFCEPELPLALWRAYGGNGRGVAFGIAKETLELKGREQDFKFAKIEYLDKTTMLNRAMQFWRKHKNDSSEELEHALQEYYLDGYFIKRSENAYEREWRLVFIYKKLGDYGRITSEVPDVPEEIEGYVKGDNLVLFYKLPINQEQRIIEYVYPGPQCKITDNELRLLLKKRGIQILGIGHDDTVMR